MAAICEMGILEGQEKQKVDTGLGFGGLVRMGYADSIFALARRVLGQGCSGSKKCLNVVFFCNEIPYFILK